MEDSEFQELLDESRTGKKRDWRGHKLMNDYLALLYDSISPDKAMRLRSCATDLIYAVQSDKKTKRLRSANFCRVRLCPMCSWRRSLKVYKQMTDIINFAERDNQYGYLFVTLTMRNCSPDQLSDTLDHLFKSHTRFIQCKRIKDMVLGWYRGVEITHNTLDDTYHPHIHMIMAVNKGYFSGKKYLKQAVLTDLWKFCLRANYRPIVDVRRVKGNTAKSIAECAKYAVKSADYIILDDWNMSLDTVRLLDTVLANRRFVAFGGLFKQIHKELRLSDPIDGDLINIDDQVQTAEDLELIKYTWHTGYCQYYKTEF